MPRFFFRHADSMWLFRLQWLQVALILAYGHSEPVWFLVPHLPHVPIGKEKGLLSLFSFCDAFCVFESARWVFFFAIWFTSVCFGPWTVSLTSLATSSVSWATATAFANVSSLSFRQKSAFSTASLLTEHMKRCAVPRLVGLWLFKVTCNNVLTNSSCQTQELFLLAYI